MSDTTRIMVQEHENISRMLRVIRRKCCGILEGADVDTEEFREIIDFIRRYADQHHHGKEEVFLFPEMVSRLGPVADNLITHGMLVEHDLGRSHVLALETACGLYEEDPRTEYKLDILTHAMGYANLLQEHVEKENNAVYPFADRSLDPEILAELDEKCRNYEAEKQKEGVQEHYLNLLEHLEAVYGLAS
jgi:hemerythrin-like domain-containing protein